jgi:hypothetical protein
LNTKGAKQKKLSFSVNYGASLIYYYDEEVCLLRVRFSRMSSININMRQMAAGLPDFSWCMIPKLEKNVPNDQRKCAKWS